MTRVLVVHNDPAIADRVAANLQLAGYDTDTCLGPMDQQCPVVEGLPCPRADGSDVLVYDARVVGDAEGMRNLALHLRDVYADLPVVLTSVDDSAGWVTLDGPDRVVPVPLDADPTALREAVETALTEQGMAV